MSLQDLKRERKNLSRIRKEQEPILKELDLLVEVPEVARYIELSIIKEGLCKKEKESAERLHWLNIETCNHLMVSIGVDHDYREGRCYPRYFCLKCGLTNAYEGLGTTYDNYHSKMNDMWARYGFYSVRSHLIPPNSLHCDDIIEVQRLKKQCNVIVKKYPKITNDELVSRIVQTSE